MYSERVWAIFWFLVIAMVAVLIATCTYVSHLGNECDNVAIQSLIRAGHSPVEARCAVKGSEGSEKQALICQAAVLMRDR